jgi:hypothetical protein
MGQGMIGYNCNLLHIYHHLMRDVDAINRRYEPFIIKIYMMKEAAWYNAPLLQHPSLYKVPNLEYVNHHMEANHPSPSDINASDPFATCTAMITICSPRMITRTEHFKLFQPTYFTETCINQQVVRSNVAGTITWVSLDDVQQIIVLSRVITAACQLQHVAASVSQHQYFTAPHHIHPPSSNHTHIQLRARETTRQARLWVHPFSRHSSRRS